MIKLANSNFNPVNEINNKTYPPIHSNNNRVNYVVNNSNRSNFVKVAQQSITCLGSALTTIGITSLITAGVFHINSKLLEAVLLYAGAGAVIVGTFTLYYGCTISVCPKTIIRIPNNNNNAITVV